MDGRTDGRASFVSVPCLGDHMHNYFFFAFGPFSPGHYYLVDYV